MAEGKRFSRDFFNRYTPDVARDLIGARIVRVMKGRRLAGIVVETEAYRGTCDPASHAYRGKTERNSVMFGRPGHAYVYFTMGMHYCLNVTAEREGVAGAVLLRAIEPAEGVPAMTRNRGMDDLARLGAGPGNLTKALGVDLKLNGEDLVESERLFLEMGSGSLPIGKSTRVGITSGTSMRWRYFAKGNMHVSKGRPS
jgi:DNA-3-methyladenine glycosylase